MMTITQNLVRPLALAAMLLLGAAASSAASSQHPLMLGVYPGGSLQAPYIIDVIRAMDAWMAPHRMMIAGDFMDLEFGSPSFNIPAELNGAWDAGYVPFVNLMSTRSGTAIAGGAIDTATRTWARHFAIWSKSPGGPKRAFLAPLPEMNGYWTPYNAGGPAAFITAYRRIRQIFEEELASAGVESTVISWVFAPNGGTAPEDAFELYYPGHDVVDIVGFSAYNYGGCPPAADWLRWETYDRAIKPYLNRMRSMASNKPIFLTQTGSLALPVNGVGDKNEWLDDAYTKLAAYPSVRAVIYFNERFQNSSAFPNCPDADFRIHDPSKDPDAWPGFLTALADPASHFGYYAPASAAVRDLVFGRTEQIFVDVDQIHPWLAGDDGQVDSASWIHALYASGITSGCATSPPRYCPDSSVTREQMAAFLMRGIEGADYTPPDASGTRFGDVPADHPFARWIEALAGAGITGGCSQDNYCPGSVVTREQMAVFLLRAMRGSDYVPPPATGTVFGDVAADHPFAQWIEELARAGITGGCSGGNYCPANPVTRGQMAIFLVKAFELPL